MASAYGIARTYNEFIPPVDLKLLGQAMEVKQQKFDTNFTNIQNTIDLLGNVDLIKDADREYFGERVKGLIEDINTFGDINLSSNAVSSQIQSHIKQALDENVMNGMEGTAKYRNYMKEVEDYKKNKPEKFNEINRMYGLLPFTSWLNDGQAGTTYGNLEYTPYVDIEKEKSDFIAEIVKSKGIGKMDYLDNKGNKITVSTWGLSDEDIRQIAESRFNEQDDKQLEINGWYNTGGATTEELQSKLQGHYKSMGLNLDSNIEQLESELKQTPVGEARDKLAAKLHYYQTRKQGLDNTIPSLMNQSNKEIGKYFAKEKIIGDMIDIYQKSDVSRELSEDKAFWEAQKTSIERAKLQNDNIRTGIELEKWNAEKEAKRGAAAGGITTTNLDVITDGGETDGVVKTGDALTDATQEGEGISNQINDLFNRASIGASIRADHINRNTSPEERLEAILKNPGATADDKAKAAILLTSYTANSQRRREIYNVSIDFVKAKAWALGKKQGLKDKYGKEYADYQGLIKGYQAQYLDNYNDPIKSKQYLQLMITTLVAAGTSQDKIDAYVKQTNDVYKNNEYTYLGEYNKEMTGARKTKEGVAERSGVPTNFEKVSRKRGNGMFYDIAKMGKEEIINFNNKMEGVQPTLQENKALTIKPGTPDYDEFFTQANASQVASGQIGSVAFDKTKDLVIWKNKSKDKNTYTIRQAGKDGKVGVGEGALFNSNALSTAEVTASNIEPIFTKYNIVSHFEKNHIKTKGLKMNGGKLLDPLNTKDAGVLKKIQEIDPNGYYNTLLLSSNIVKNNFDNNTVYGKTTFITDGGAAIKIQNFYDNMEKVTYKWDDDTDLHGNNVAVVYFDGKKVGSSYYKGLSSANITSLNLARAVILNNMLLQGKTK